ncbi:MAG: acetyltransferase, family [Labilithrix sp.]|nr:acetyltransferase, family [Labilithrix sp.]
MGYLNEVFFTQLAPEDTDRAIDDAIGVYRAHRLATKWYVTPETRPEDLGERLARRGFDSWDCRAMGVDTDHAVHAAPAVSVTDVDEGSLDAYLRVTLEGWAMGEDQREIEHAAHLLELRRRPQTAHFFMASVAGKPVGTAGIFLRDGGYGYLVGGLVLEAARGGGAYRALVAARLAFLRARGNGFAVTIARETTSAPMLAHLGFETIFRGKCYLLAYTD